ncbi:hypothetical protein ACFQU7_10510 [Pseudoroseomonas wenyumeiae]
MNEPCPAGLLHDATHGLGKLEHAGYRQAMDTYVPALMLLSGASFLNSRSNVPELRPASEAADTAWKLLAQFSFLFWLGLLIWGAVMRPWFEPVLGFATSLLFNLVLAVRGRARPGRACR